MELLRGKCRHRGPADILADAECKRLAAQVPAWTVDGVFLVRQFAAASFSEAATLIVGIAKIADKHDHHPDVSLTKYRHVELRFTTHSAGGLTLNDFIVAANVEKLLAGLSS